MSDEPAHVSGSGRLAGDAEARLARADRARPTDPGLGYVPGFDALRALAVAAVVAYHLGYGWAGGGFLGVSLFFTLSGYLITSLLLAEHAATGRVSLGAFWARRARRILPASLATLLVVVVAARWLPSPASLPGDVRAAVGQVANWRFILGHRSYADLFANASPLRHWWSLAIEEQLYVALPIVAVVALRFGRRTFAIVLATAASASVAMSFVLSHASFDRVYQGTDTRAVELLVGALAACLASPARLAAARPTARMRLGVASAFGLLLAVWIVTRLDQGWLRHGFGLLGLANIAVVLAAATPIGAELLARRPLLALGRISYGVYLIHWPVVTWLTADRTGWSRPVVDAARIGLTLALAAASYRWIERPLRHGAPAIGWRFPVALGSAGAVLASTMAIGVAPLTGAAGVLAAYRPPPVPVAAPSTSTPVSPAAVAAATTTTTVPSGPMVWVVGDSVPLSLGPAFSDASGARHVRVLDLAVPGCDGARGQPTVRLGWGFVDAETERAPDCVNWAERWPGYAHGLPPDAVLLMLGGHVVVDRQIDGVWRSPCDAEFAAWYQPEVLARVDWVLASSAAVPLLTLAPWQDAKATGVLQGDHRDRVDCVNTIYRAVAAARPAVRLIDLQSFVCPAGKAADCQPWRPTDGLHYEGAGATIVAGWLLDQTLTAMTTPAPAPTPLPVPAVSWRRAPG